MIAPRDSTLESKSISLMVNYMHSTTKKPLCLQSTNVSKPPLWQYLDALQVKRSINAGLVLGLKPLVVSRGTRRGTQALIASLPVTFSFFFFKRSCFCKQGYLERIVNTCVLGNTVCHQDTWMLRSLSLADKCNAAGRLVHRLMICVISQKLVVLVGHSKIFYHFILFNL